MKNLHIGFETGRLSDCLNYFSIPCTIIDPSSGHIEVIRTNLEFSEMLVGYFQALFAQNVTERRVEVENIDQAPKDRVRATVLLLEYNAEGEQVAKSCIRYTLAPIKRTHVIEVVEMLEPPPRIDVLGTSFH